MLSPEQAQTHSDSANNRHGLEQAYTAAALATATLLHTSMTYTQHLTVSHKPRRLCVVASTLRAVANLAVALLSLEESEGRLLDFLARARNPLGKPLFDPKYALRLAKDRNRCVLQHMALSTV